MTTYTIDPVNNKLVPDKDSKDVKMIKKLKNEKKPERIEVTPIELNLDFPVKPSIVDKTVEQHIADTEREYYKNYNENNEALNSGGIASLFKPKR